MLRAATQGKVVVAPDTPQYPTARALERKGAATLVDGVVTLTPAGTAEAERRHLPKALVNITPPQLKAFAEVVRRAVKGERPAWIGVDLYEPTVEALVRRGLVLIEFGRGGHQVLDAGQCRVVGATLQIALDLQQVAIVDREGDHGHHGNHQQRDQHQGSAPATLTRSRLIDASAATWRFRADRSHGVSPEGSSRASAAWQSRKWKWNWHWKLMGSF